MKTIRKVIRGVLVFLGAWLLIGTALVFYGLYGAEDRVKTTCAEIAPGMQLEALVAFAESRGMTFGLTGKDMAEEAILSEKRSGGRHGCRVEVANDQAVRARSYHID